MVNLLIQGGVQRWLRLIYHYVAALAMPCSEPTVAWGQIAFHNVMILSVRLQTALSVWLEVWFGFIKSHKIFNRID